MNLLSFAPSSEYWWHFNMATPFREYTKEKQWLMMWFLRWECTTTDEIYRRMTDMAIKAWVRGMDENI
jgi:hypothetical protein